MVSGIVMSPNEEKDNLLYDRKDIVQFEYPAVGQTVEQHGYLEIVVRLHEAVLRQRTEILPDACTPSK
jgi:hypothetical protein